MRSLPKPTRAKKPRKPLRRSHRRGDHTSRHRAKRKASARLADRLFSEYIRTRDDWQCRNCGSPKHPQCAHVVSRRYRAIRWSSENAVCLCKRCHMKYTNDPIGWEKWVEDRWPGRLAELKRLAWAGVAKIDHEAVCVGLMVSLAALSERRG
jgi:hypothetical protein